MQQKILFRSTFKGGRISESQVFTTTWNLGQEFLEDVVMNMFGYCNYRAVNPLRKGMAGIVSLEAGLAQIYSLRRGGFE